MSRQRDLPLIALATLLVAIFWAPAPAGPTSQPTTGPSVGAAEEGPSVLPPKSDGQTLSTASSVRVRRFAFEGNTVFSNEQLREIVEKSIKARHKDWPAADEVSLDELEEARLALSQYYVDHSYINSGATLPDQRVDRGVITFRIVEGKVSEVKLAFHGKDAAAGNRHLLSDRYVVDRVKYASGPPLNIQRLKDELELLRVDPNIKSVNAELKPGTAAGESIVDMQVQENNPFQLGLQFSNRRPPSVGSIAFDVLASDSDLTGRGDPLAVRYDVLSGPIQDLRLAGAKDFSVDYALPFTAADTTVSFNFSRTDTVVVDQAFEALNISSESNNTSITLRQPVYRKPTAEPASPDHRASPSVEVDLFVTGAIRDNRTSLLGRPFSFSPGDKNGTEHVTVLRFGQEVVLRNERDALSGRSTLSVGVPWFDSTQNPRGVADGDFIAWLGQVQYVHLIGKSDVQLVLRGAAQLSDRSLLTLEQFSLGGVESVRGYPENFLVRDEGVAGSVEFHVPILRKNNTDILTLIPFFDAGYGWDRKHSSGKSEVLDAPGIGLQFTPDRHFTAQIYYGSALQNHARGSHDVENTGLHFNILMLAF